MCQTTNIALLHSCLSCVCLIWCKVTCALVEHEFMNIRKSTKKWTNILFDKVPIMRKRQEYHQDSFYSLLFRCSLQHHHYRRFFRLSICLRGLMASRWLHTSIGLGCTYSKHDFEKSFLMSFWSEMHIQYFKFKYD